MNYLTTKEMAEKWGVSQRRVLRLVSDGRIEGARILGKTWMIPENTPKPADGRTQKAKNGEPTVDRFRFPLYLNFDADRYSPALTEEELQLRRAQLDFHACNFKESYEGMNHLCKNAENNLVKISAYYHCCLLSLVFDTEQSLNYYVYQLHRALAEETEHTEDLKLITFWLDSELLVYNRSVYENFTVNPEYRYHQSVYYLLICLSLIALSKGDLSLCRTLNFDSFELNCQQMEQNGYYYEAQDLHSKLYIIYVTRFEQKKAMYHLKRLLTIAYEKNLLYCAACFYCYYTNEYEKALADFPKDFADKIKKLGTYTYKRFRAYAVAHDLTCYNILSKQQLQFCVYATQNYTNRQIAEKLHFSESAVKKIYSETYKKLNVTSKKELVELVYQAFDCNITENEKKTKNSN